MTKNDTEKNNKSWQNMNEIKVAVLVAVHNTGKYLRRCLDPLVNQTLKALAMRLVKEERQAGLDYCELILRYLKYGHDAALSGGESFLLRDRRTIQGGGK